MKKPKYTYGRSGSGWGVWEWQYSQTGGLGTKIADFVERKDARAEVFRLNGWKEKEKE